MYRYKACAFVIVLVFITCVSAIPQLPYLWPYPSSVSYGENTIPVNRDKFTCTVPHALNSEAQGILKSAIERYTELIFWHEGGHEITTGISSVDINIQEAHSKPMLSLNSDESYVLQVTGDDTIKLDAVSVWGALRGLETLSQVLHYNSSQGHYNVPNTPLTIKDQPEFRWRGLLVDTARHYLSVDTLFHIIDSLAYNKMNVMHWHAVDAQSFPIEIPSRPQLNKMGAYAPPAVYTSKDIQRIVSHGKTRGVRVVVETDVPGHTASWGKAYPEITTHCPELSASNINVVPLNPTHNMTFQVVGDVIKDVSNMFPDQFLHLGGDEVQTQCWEADTQVKAWMQQRGWGTDWDRLWGYFEENIQPFWQKIGNKTMVAWEELLLEQNTYTVPKEVVIHAWRQKTSLFQAVSDGYRGLQSYGWYLDQMSPANKHYYLWGDTWKIFYTQHPIDSSVGSWTAEMRERVLGGEACMWGEQVDDVNFDARVWPRASAVAERLWSPASVNDLSQAKERISVHRCRLVRRGVAAGPLQPGYCAQVY